MKRCPACLMTVYPRFIGLTALDLRQSREVREHRLADPVMECTDCGLQVRRSTFEVIR